MNHNRPPGPICCSYDLDRQLVIAALGPGWDVFAIENGAPQLVSPQPLGQPLLMYLTDATTVHLYERIFERVSVTRRAVTFPIRCDGATIRRYLDLTIAIRPAGGFRVTTVLTRSERRTPIRLLQPAVSRTQELLVMCSWCKRIRLKGGWAEVEDAVAQLRLFERDEQPDVTHGICEQCHRFMATLLLDDAELPSR
jgi:hypothetical protein